MNNHSFNEEDIETDTYVSFKDRFAAYKFSCREMLQSSASHLLKPVTIIVIILLIATYILLGVAGTVGFSFYSSNIEHYVTTNLDIIVNALLGYFFGPVTCAISVTLCTIVRMIAMGSNFFIGNVLGACMAGFIHGWILYRLRPYWLETRFRSFYTDMLIKTIETRLFVSTFVNIIFMSVMHKLLNGYPFIVYLTFYSKSRIPLSSVSEFFKVFVLGIAFESIVVFVAIVIANFIAHRAFASQFVKPDVIVDRHGHIITPDDDPDVFNETNF
ncbi:MAG: hypothetical protein IKA17_00485 [Clostridia bacterium]|nr:hypothetical protein [Clostridia bacterium]